MNAILGLSLPRVSKKAETHRGQNYEVLRGVFNRRRFQGMMKKNYYGLSEPGAGSAAGAGAGSAAGAGADSVVGGILGVEGTTGFTTGG